MQRPNLAPYYRWLTVLTAGLVLLQAAFAGRGLSGEPGYFDYHEVLANGLFLIAIGQFVFTLALGIPGQLGKRLKWLNAVMTVLVVVQIGLGYSGRTELEARAWHIPLGVLIFGLSVVIASMAPQVSRERE
jgi:hypothetical protein